MKKKVLSMLSIVFVVLGLLSANSAFAFTPYPYYTDSQALSYTAGKAGTYDTLWYTGSNGLKFNCTQDIFGTTTCLNGGDRRNFPGEIIDQTLHWKYSQGTAFTYPSMYAKQYNPHDGTWWDEYYWVGAKMLFDNPTADQNVMVYMDKWEESTQNWVEQAHTGNYSTGGEEPIMTKNHFSGVPGYVLFTQTYAGALKNCSTNIFRLRFSVPNAADWTQTSFYWWDYTIFYPAP
jgi:hypothetical protein